jgi:polysaccharide export outer membrane protein
MRKLLTGFICTMILALSAGVAAAAGYSIRPGDTLQVEVLEDTSLNRSVLVLPDGTFNFPLAGTIQAAGRSVETVQSALTSALASNFANRPTVYVSVGQLAQRVPSAGGGRAVPSGPGIYAMGEVAKPGKLESTRGITLLQGLAEAGGFTKFAATGRIELHRTDRRSGTEKVYLYDYRGGGISGSTPLQDGDVIVVPERRLFE